MTISRKLLMALSVAALAFLASPALAQTKPGDKLDKDKGAGSLKDQERSHLADAYLKAGRQLFEELRYREAAEQLRLAIKVDPGHAEARQLLDETLFILGDREAGYRDEARQYIREREVKKGLAKMEIDRVYAEGLRAMERQEYPTAIEKFERVIETIRYFPFHVDTSGMKAQAEAKMAEAQAKETEREALFKQAQQRAAQEQARIYEQRQTAYHQARIRQLYEQAEAAFERTDFRKSEQLCRSLLEQDPSNDKAAKLLERSKTARRFKDELATLENGIEEMKRLIEGVYEAAVPYQAIFSFPGEKEWAAVQKRAVDLQEAFERRGEPESAEESRIKQTLASRRVTIQFPPGTTFEDAINFLRDITGLNYVIAQPAVEAIAANPPSINLKLRDIFLRNALELILQQAKDLVYKIKHDAIYINTKDAEKEDLYLRFYEVSEIVNDLPMNPAPKLALPDTQTTGGGQGGGQGVVLTTDEGEQPKPGITAEKLKELIDQKIGEGEGSVEYMGGLLMVRKSLEAHRNVERLLESLRRTTGVMVTVETKIIDIQDNFLEEIGIDFRGLPSVIPNIFGTGGRSTTGYNWTNKDQDVDIRARTFTGFSNPLGSAASTPFNLTNVGGAAFQYNVLDDFQFQAIIDAVKKSQKAKQVDAPRLTVFNAQQSHVLAMRQEAYISDVEVNQTGVTPTLNPVIGILNSGSILEARPIVSHDRKFVTLEIQPTLAQHVTSNFQLVTLSNGFTGIVVELPVVTLNETRSTVMVPDGGTVILGGLKNFLDQRSQVGVPIFDNIPVLGLLFQRNGWADLKRSQIVLLTVDITIAREEEAKRFNKQPPPAPQVR